VAGGLIRKWWRRAPVHSPEVEEALGELAKLAGERPTLAGPIAVLRDVLPRLYEEPIREMAPTLSPQQAAAKLADGVPLLRGETFSLDVQTFRQRWQHVCAVMQQQGTDAVQGLAEALRHDRLVPAELLGELLAGRPEAIHAQAEALSLDAGLMAIVLRLTLFPVLTSISAVLTPLREGLRWEQGYCPMCGSWPLLGEFRGLEQTRWLRCGLCAAAWECPRLFCPFCGQRDHRLLGYFHVEGEENKYRAATCDSCRGYVKMIATLTALSAPRLLVADVATMHLDLAAAERGYVVPSRWQ
jgi:FdhE protein